MSAPFDPAIGDIVPAPTLDFTLTAVLGFARSKPADEEYDYYSVQGCALCQFLRSAGIEFSAVGHEFWRLENDRRPLPEGLNEAVWELPRTFGALASRLEALS